MFYRVLNMSLQKQPSIGVFRKRCLKIHSSKFTGEHPCRNVIQWWWWCMLMNCFCGMVDQWKAFSLISSRDHYQRSSPSWISEVLRAGSNLRRTWVPAWLKLRSSDNHYNTAPHNKVASQLYWNRTSAWEFSYKFAAYL